MRFTYTYRSSDGQHHTADIEAESRDAAYARLRTEYGIKPIKVTACEIPVQGKTQPPHLMAWLAVVVLVVIAVGVGGWWLYSRNGHDQQPPTQFTVNTPQGPVTYIVATSLPRQAIPGDRMKIDGKRDVIFASRAEQYLSRFAEPGRPVANWDGARPSDEEFTASLRESIRIASTDFTEVVDLKRIVTGMKRELRAYLSGGGTLDAYLAELEKRQRLEISFRENAERRLEEMLSKTQEAYAYWLKANAQLQAMGIYPLALPEALRAYQTSISIN